MDKIKQLLKDTWKFIEDKCCMEVKTWHVMFSLLLQAVTLGLA